MTRIESLSQSPCSNCGVSVECGKKVKRNSKFEEIVDVVYGNRDFDFHDCPLYIALTAPEMVEEEE